MIPGVGTQLVLNDFQTKFFMIRSFLTITLRILWRNKVTSFVNIFSLSIGITSFIFIMLYVHHETTFDKFHENYDHIYRLEGDDFAKLPPVIGDFVNDKSEITGGGRAIRVSR